MDVLSGLDSRTAPAHTVFEDTFDQLDTRRLYLFSGNARTTEHYSTNERKNCHGNIGEDELDTFLQQIFEEGSMC